MRIVLQQSLEEIIISIMQPNQPAGISLPRRQRINGLLIPLILMTLLLCVAAAFALWAFGSRQDYKNNVDKKIDEAVTLANQITSTSKDKEYVEKEKNPLKSYLGPATYGGVSLMYPKTWSAYIGESNDSSMPIEGYLHPNFVPSLQSKTAFALRMQVVNQPYVQVMRQFDSNTKIGTVRVTPYKADKVPSVLGSRADGEITPGQQVSMVIFPIRDKTLKVWTESDTFDKDFDTIILPNLSFTP